MSYTTTITVQLTSANRDKADADLDYLASEIIAYDEVSRIAVSPPCEGELEDEIARS